MMDKLLKRDIKYGWSTEFNTLMSRTPIELIPHANNSMVLFVWIFMGPELINLGGSLYKRLKKCLTR